MQSAILSPFIQWGIWTQTKQRLMLGRNQVSKFGEAKYILGG